MDLPYGSTSQRLQPSGRRGVPGGLCAMHVGNGVVAYFARPTDLRSLVRTLRVETHTGQAAREATLIQNQVIAPLMTPPQPVNMTLRRDRLSPGNALRVTADRSRSIRRKRKGRKPKQLQDGFSLTKWQQAQSKATGKFAKERTSRLFRISSSSAPLTRPRTRFN